MVQAQGQNNPAELEQQLEQERKEKQELLLKVASLKVRSR